MNIYLKYGDYQMEGQNRLQSTSQGTVTSGYFYGYLLFMQAHKISL